MPREAEHHPSPGRPTNLRRVYEKLRLRLHPLLWWGVAGLIEGPPQQLCAAEGVAEATAKKPEDASDRVEDGLRGYHSGDHDKVRVGVMNMSPDLVFCFDVRLGVVCVLVLVLARPLKRGKERRTSLGGRNMGHITLEPLIGP